MNKKKSELIIDNYEENKIQKLFTQLKSIEDIKKLDKFHLDFIGKEIILKIIEGDLITNKKIKDDFYNLNYVIDDYLQEKESEIEAYYNIFAFHYLSDLSNYLIMNQNETMNLKIIYNKMPYTKIIDTLSSNNFLSHQELANRLNLSKSNLTNYLNKIKVYDVIQVKNIVDKKKKFYFLTYKTKQFLKQNKKCLSNKKSKWLGSYEEKNISYKNYITTAKEVMMYVKQESSINIREIHKSSKYDY